MSKQPKTDTDAPYTAAGLAERRGVTVSGWARERSTAAARNGSYMISMPLGGVGGGPAESDSAIDADFTEKVNRTENMNKTLYVKRIREVLISIAIPGLLRFRILRIRILVGVFLPTRGSTDAPA